jgi:hypothetical protein
MAPSFFFSNVVLNDLKHETSKGCRTCEICDGKVTMFEPNWWACFIVCRITCDPCSFRISGWQLVKEIPLGIDLLRIL